MEGLEQVVSGSQMLNKLDSYGYRGRLVSRHHAKPVIIDEARYLALLWSERKLEALDAGGVDNWGGYCESLSGVRDAFEAEDHLTAVRGSGDAVTP